SELVIVFAWFSNFSTSGGLETRHFFRFVFHGYSHHPAADGGNRFGHFLGLRRSGDFQARACRPTRQDIHFVQVSHHGGGHERWPQSPTHGNRRYPIHSHRSSFAPHPLG